MLNNKTIHPFQEIPNELIGEILCYIPPVELIFSSFNKVSQHWHRVCNQLLFNHYIQRKLFNNNYDHYIHSHDDHHVDDKNSDHKEDQNDWKDNVNEFCNSREGRRFKKFLLREHVYRVSCRLLDCAKESLEQKQILVEGEWVDEELRILKGYFASFSDLRGQLEESQSNGSDSGSGGLFGSVLSMIGSFFSKSKTSNSSSSSSSSSASVVATTNNNTDYDYLTKILLDGNAGVGKTSFFNCVLLDNAVNPSSPYMASLGLDFGIRTFHFGETTKVKYQLWDQNGFDQFSRYHSNYRGASFILLLADPYSEITEYSKNAFENRLNNMKSGAPKAEVIFITTKKDTNSTAKIINISNEQADCFAYQKFGGIHLDITNTELKDPKSIICYCAVLRYLLGEYSFL